MLKDVAERVGIAESTLRVQLHRARKRFGELYRHVYGRSAAREDDPLSTAPRKSVPRLRAEPVAVIVTTTSPEGAFLAIIKSRRGSVLASCTAERGAQGYLFQWGSNPAHPEAWASPAFSKGHTFELHDQPIGQTLYLRIAIVRRGSLQSQWTQVLQVLVR